MHNKTGQSKLNSWDARRKAKSEIELGHVTYPAWSKLPQDAERLRYMFCVFPTPSRCQDWEDLENIMTNDGATPPSLERSSSMWEDQWIKTIVITKLVCHFTIMLRISQRFPDAFTSCYISTQVTKCQAIYSNAHRPASKPDKSQHVTELSLLKHKVALHDTSSRLRAKQNVETGPCKDTLCEKNMIIGGATLLARPGAKHGLRAASRILCLSFSAACVRTLAAMGGLRRAKSDDAWRMKQQKVWPSRLHIRVNCLVCNAIVCAK